MPPTTTTYEFGDIVLVPFPFTDQVGSKWRPAAVISGAGYDEAPAVIISSRSYNERQLDVIIVIGISGEVSQGVYSIILTNWQDLNLKHLSAIKPLIATVEKRKVKKIGHLTAPQRTELKKLLGRMLG